MNGRNNYKATPSIKHRLALLCSVVAFALAASITLACGTSGSANSGSTGDHDPKLAEGMAAPDFTLPSDDGRIVKLSDYKGKQPVVLYFYPKDETPGCTKQACSFRDNFKAFRDAGIEVLGVSVDTVDSHKEFKRNQKLNFTLLADDKKEVSKQYGVLSERGYSSRVTFVIDKEGMVRKIYRNVDPVANATETLAFAKTL